LEHTPARNYSCIGIEDGPAFAQYITLNDLAGNPSRRLPSGVDGEYEHYAEVFGSPHRKVKFETPPANAGHVGQLQN